MLTVIFRKSCRQESSWTDAGAVLAGDDDAVEAARRQQTVDGAACGERRRYAAPRRRVLQRRAEHAQVSVGARAVPRRTHLGTSKMSFFFFTRS